MKKLNKVAICRRCRSARNRCWRTEIDNWRNGTSELVWKNGTNELCWRDASWTPATAAAGCDGAIKAAPAAAPHLLQHLLPLQLPSLLLSQHQHPLLLLLPPR
jgi:OOP family OmpA-OmpF porin